MTVIQDGDVADRLVSWGRAKGRRYPWRHVRDPFAIAVAEILLQKTKADDARPVWEQLIARYPTPELLAAEARDTLVAAVGHLGLGNQRADRLQAMAHGLTSGSSWRTASGLGPYGKGVLALAGGESFETPPVDGNVARIITRVKRLSWERGEPRKKREVRLALQSWFNASATSGERLELLYALVDLGYAVCTPTNPACGACPLSDVCASSFVMPS